MGIGLILGVAGAFVYCNWAKKEEGVYFQKNIGEGKIFSKMQKWAMKNPLQATILGEEIQKSLGILEELRNETNPEVIQRRVMTRLTELNEEERGKIFTENAEILENHAPALLSDLEQELPWYLCYKWLAFFLIVLVCSGVGFSIGYLFEPEEKVI